MEERALHYRLFAKLLLFVTLFLGGLIGYVTGFEMGQQNAVKLMEEGRLAGMTVLDKDLAQEANLLNQKIIACYQDKLGAEAYSQIAAGVAELSTDQVFALIPCSNLND